MKNIYQQRLKDLYMSKIYDLYSLGNLHYSQEEPQYGLLRLNIIEQGTNKPVPNATVTLYVTDGVERDIPIMHLITTLNPFRFELPMANDLGTQIVGPEYDFSTYNLRVDAFGYFANIVYNIRLFPNVTTDFEIAMIPISQIQSPTDIEERTNIPPHLRDVVIE